MPIKENSGSPEVILSSKDEKRQDSTHVSVH